MNWDRIENNWKEFKGDVKTQWGELSDHQLNSSAGKRDQLVHEIQKTYGISEHAAEWQVSGWQARLADQNLSMTHESKRPGITNWWPQTNQQNFNK